MTALKRWRAHRQARIARARWLHPQQARQQRVRPLVPCGSQSVRVGAAVAANSSSPRCEGVARGRRAERREAHELQRTAHRSAVRARTTGGSPHHLRERPLRQCAECRAERCCYRLALEGILGRRLSRTKCSFGNTCGGSVRTSRDRPVNVPQEGRRQKCTTSLADGGVDKHDEQCVASGVLAKVYEDVTDSVQTQSRSRRAAEVSSQHIGTIEVQHVQHRAEAQVITSCDAARRETCASE